MKILGYEIKRYKRVPIKKTPVDAAKENKIVSLPPGRVSSPSDLMENGGFHLLKKGVTLVTPKFVFEHIPLIRSLYKYNEDMGTVLNDLIQLTNTGHTIKFDQSIDPDKVDKMRAHLKERSKTWGHGVAGLNGLINKMIAQIWIGGALSIEAYPDFRLTKVDNISLVNPETIRWAIKKNGKYAPWQKVNKIMGGSGDHIKLNENTFLYYGMLGDEDNPYGIPPFLTALTAIATQGDMKANINHILNQMGLLGYLEIIMDKPSQMADESEPAYKIRLESFLKEAKTNVLKGFKTGVVAGYEEDHKFEFHSTTKNLNGVSDLFNMNENQVANGLKTTAAFLGIEATGGGEGQLGIVFTKMLSQLKSVQNILIFGLEHIYKLELSLAGFDFKGLVVEFRPSTITDDLKWQQAQEIKQRVLRGLWIDRIIGPDQYADEMGYQKPHKIIEPPEPMADTGGAKKDEDREKDKDKSDRKGRDKDKSQPRRKDRDTKNISIV